MPSKEALSRIKINKLLEKAKEKISSDIEIKKAVENEQWDNDSF